MQKPKRKPYTPAPPDERKLGISGLKQALIDEAQDDKPGFAKEMLNSAKDRLTGMHQSIANEAIRLGRISDKQAYVLAAQLVDSGTVHYSHYVDYGKEECRK